MMKRLENVVFDIDEAGNLHGLYTDFVDLFSVGRVINVHKASSVEFNESKQCWQVISLDGEILHENPNRESAIEWEIEAMSPEGVYYDPMDR